MLILGVISNLLASHYVVQDLRGRNPLVALSLSALARRHPVSVLHLTLRLSFQSIVDLPCKSFLELLGELLGNGDLIRWQVDYRSDAEASVLASQGEDNTQGSKFKVSLSANWSFSTGQECLEMVGDSLDYRTELSFL